ncbi:MAG: ATP-binding cassette domain-containing protein, partial [Schleiferiaceae bacterium]|nr:ATP-binding cassette domain-containing protein [Schleiferiaceae bacterium]
MATRLRASEILHGFDRFLLSIPHWEAASGQVVALLGPSGSGKSTFLNMLGARMVPDEGKVWYAGKPHKRIPLVPGHPRIRMVRQDFGQMPYKSVRDNLLEFSGIRSEAAEHRLVKQWMKRMNLAPALTDKAKALSGGELQRLAIAQAMIGQPGALLLDEPFSHLDPMSKLMIQDMLREWQPRSNSTVVMVVHDVRDAMAWADRIDVMIDGSIVESGSPQAIYENPQSEAMAYAFGRVNAFPVATAPEPMRNNPKAFVIN